MRTYAHVDASDDTQVIFFLKGKKRSVMKLTDYEIRRHRLPNDDEQKIVCDERLAGFGVHFRRSGSHSFVVQYGSGKNRKRISIGRVGEIEAAKAFEIAKNQIARNSPRP